MVKVKVGAVVREASWRGSVIVVKVRGDFYLA